MNVSWRTSNQGIGCQGYMLRFVQYESRMGIESNAYVGDIVSARVIFTVPARRSFH